MAVERTQADAGTAPACIIKGSLTAVPGFIHRIVGDEFPTVDITCRVRHGEHDGIGDLLGRAPARIAHVLIARPLCALARGVFGTELPLGKLALPLGEALRRIDNLACHTSE